MLSSNLSDAHFDLSWISDAIHGPIDTRDAHSLEGERRLITLMNSRPLDRLRRVKQVFFAPQSYLSADHSRYAHSVGTMHVMRLLLTRLRTQDAFPAELFSELHRLFPDTFDSPSSSTYDVLAQHLLTAALLLDIGELPFSQATRHVFSPHPELRRTVETVAGVDASELTNKQIFAIGCLIDSSQKRLVDGYSVPFLIFLLSGHGISSLPPQSALRMLRQMLDGVVDADRLDYVHRDAHHTIGSIITSAPIVDTIESYDAQGPIFNDPGPGSLFLAMRAHLSSTVYLAPAIRFRTLLLIHLLQGIARNEKCAEEFFGAGGKAELTTEDFLELDDASQIVRITDFAQSRTRFQLDSRSKLALDMFVGAAVPYESSWLPAASNGDAANLEIKLPQELFYDTFSDQTRTLYYPGSVRIQSKRFSHFPEPTPLEQCGGPFTSLFKEECPTLPMPGSTQLFIPRHRSGQAWKEFDTALEDGWLPLALSAQDPLSGIDVPSDTRDLNGFHGPSIFVSFSWADEVVLIKVVRELYRRRLRYHVLLRPFQGVGGTPGENSVAAVRGAERAIVLVSTDYIKRYRDAANGNIHKEVYEMSRHKMARNRKVGFLSVDPFRDVRDGLPWSAFDYDETPFLGSPLRHATDNTVAEAIEAYLEYVNKNDS